MRRMKVWIAVTTLIATALTGQQAEAAVNAGVLFLRIAAGGRAAAMGETFVAIANDATATHWNPAGLGTYPLSSHWEEINFPGIGTVRDAALIKNGLPYTNYAGYDVWILSDSGLVRLTSTALESGRTTVTIETDGVSSVAAAIRRYAPFLGESESEDIAASVSGALIGVPLRDLEPLLDRLLNSLPADHRDRTLVENAVRDFRAAVREARLDVSRLPEVREALGALPQSGEAALETVDRARFALERSVVRQIPYELEVPLNALFAPPLRAIAGDGQNMFLAAGGRLLAFDGERWSAIAPPTGSNWEDEEINAVSVVGGTRLWVGTNKGLLARTTGEWTRFTTADGLPSDVVTAVRIPGQRDGWVMTEFGLARFDGERFSSTVAVTANVGDSISSILRRFIDTEDADRVARAAADVRRINGFDAAFEPEAGASVEIPYQVGIRGDASRLDVDPYGRLWVGTNFGILRFSQGRWTSFGYTPITLAEATTARAVAESRLGERSTPERAETLSRLIIDYNELDAAGTIAAGRTIYVYRNPAASHVHDIASSDERLFIASSAGQLEVNSGDWNRYYHADLERDQVRAIAVKDGDVWFVTDDRVVIYQKPQRELTFMHSPWLPEFNLDLYYDYLSYVTQVEGWGTVGAAVTFFSYGEIIRTTEFGAEVNSFHSFDGALSLSYGTRLSPSLAGGLTAKVIYSRLADQGAGAEIGSGSATAFALDAGLLYQTPWRRLQLGAALTNLGPDISYIDAQQSDPLPRNLAVGFAYRLLDSPFNRLTLAGDVNKELVDLGGTGSELKQIIYNVGAEYWYGSFIALRGGYIYDEDGDIKVPTLGAGLSWRQLQFDFAYIPSTRDTPLANTQRYSITGRF